MCTFSTLLLFTPVYIHVCVSVLFSPLIHPSSLPPATMHAVSSYRGIACSPSFEHMRHRMLVTRCTARALRQAFPPSSQYSLHQTISMCMGTKVHVHVPVHVHVHTHTHVCMYLLSVHAFLFFLLVIYNVHIFVCRLQAKYRLHDGWG